MSLSLSLALALGLALAAPPGANAPSAPRVAETALRPALVAVDAGAFVMGTPAAEHGRDGRELPLSVVRLTRGFYIAETEVTQGQYRAVTGTNPARFSGQPGDDRRPVEGVTWLGAVKYCNALSAAEGLPPAYAIHGSGVRWLPEARGYRLPTEAEWEYAARAGTRTATHAGDLDLRGDNHAPVLDAIAWYGGNSGSTHPMAWDSTLWKGKQYPHTTAATHPVGGRRPNAWGLHDMLGNVWEWTWDRYVRGDSGGSDGAIRIDPMGPLFAGKRAFRGGAFGLRARFLRAGARDGGDEDMASDWIGLRPVRTR